MLCNSFSNSESGIRVKHTTIKEQQHMQEASRQRGVSGCATLVGTTLDLLHTTDA